MKTYITNNVLAKPCTLREHAIDTIDNVAAIPYSELIGDLLAMDYKITKHRLWDDLEGYNLIIATKDDLVLH